MLTELTFRLPSFVSQEYGLPWLLGFQRVLRELSSKGVVQKQVTGAAVSRGTLMVLGVGVTGPGNYEVSLSGPLGPVPFLLELRTGAESFFQELAVGTGVGQCQ